MSFHAFHVLQRSSVSTALGSFRRRKRNGNPPFRRLQSNTTINGTLRATLVPYDKEHASHDAVVSLLDKHAGSYPIKGEVSVS